MTDEEVKSILEGVANSLDKIFDAMERTKNRLANSSLHEEFLNFAEESYGLSNLGNNQLAGLKLSFYAGAMALMGMLEAVSDDTDKESAVDKMSLLRREIIEFSKLTRWQIENPLVPPLKKKGEDAKAEQDEEDEKARRQLQALKMMPKEYMGEA